MLAFLHLHLEESVRMIQSWSCLMQREGKMNTPSKARVQWVLVTCWLQLISICLWHLHQLCSVHINMYPSKLGISIWWNHCAHSFLFLGWDLKEKSKPWNETEGNNVNTEARISWCSVKYRKRDEVRCKEKEGNRSSLTFARESDIYEERTLPCQKILCLPFNFKKMDFKYVLYV